MTTTALSRTDAGSAAVPFVVATPDANVVAVPSSSVGTSADRARIAAAASTNLTSVKAGEAVLHSIHVTNISAAVKFLKIYNKATAPVLASDVPAFTMPLPVGHTGLIFDEGMGLTLGLAYAITGAVADTDTTALAANDVHGVMLYK